MTCIGNDVIVVRGDSMALKTTEAKRAANARYDAKTYHLIGFKLRVDEDDDIIKSIEAAHKRGVKSREWLRELYESANKK